MVEPAASDERVLAGGVLNAGRVVRVGDTVRRPRTDGAELHEAALVHLERVGFDGAPRFLGIDEQGRQVLSFVEGDVDAVPAWQLDDERNAVELGRLARLARLVHDALTDFVPPEDATPLFGIAGPGATWNHADVGYHNAVYRDARPVALIDWEAVAAGDELYDPASLVAMSAKGPRLDRPEELGDRVDATRLAVASVADGYGMSDEQYRRFPNAIATMLDHAATVWEGLGGGQAAGAPALRWKSAWFAEHADLVR